jgi:hypothetical protein
MARLHHVKHARKSYPHADIRRGDEYWWYARRHNGRGTGRVLCRTRPPRSDYATGSPFLAEVMDMEDDLGRVAVTRADEVPQRMRESADRLAEMAGECDVKAGSVRQAFPHGSHVLRTLEARAEWAAATSHDLRRAAQDIEAGADSVGQALAGIDWGVR